MPYAFIALLGVVGGFALAVMVRAYLQQCRAAEQARRTRAKKK